MSQPLRTTIRLGVAAIGVLAVGVAGLAVYATAHRRAAAPSQSAVSVAVTADGCAPTALDVEAGRVTFEIVNRSSRVLEWEILDGVMVVDERENIAPGLSQRLTTRLEPGIYAITCGLLGNPRGKLTVRPSSRNEGIGRPPDMVALVGPMAEYKVYLVVSAMELVDLTRQFADAVKQGERVQAGALLSEANATYARMRPATKLLDTGLDISLDARAADFAAGAADPGFTGFGRLSSELSVRGDPASLASLADRLARDADKLLALVSDATIPPSRMVSGAALLLGQASDGTSPDPAIASATLDGAEKVATLLRPLTRKADLAASDRLDAAFAAARAAVAKPVAEGGTRPALQALAVDFATLRNILGLDG